MLRASEGGDTIAAVIVEPVAGSTGVLIPPVGYLDRLRKICDAHGILLIFDEVITGFGRTGSAFGATRFDVLPDLICAAKGITNGSVPMGAVFARHMIYDTVVHGAPAGIELFHGYTYSGHPLAAAAGLATLDLYREENLFEKTKELEEKWADAIMSLKGQPNVVDIRTLGLVAAIDLAPHADGVGKRAYEAMDKGFRDHGIMLRITADTIALTPPLIISDNEVDELLTKLKAVIKAVA